MTNIDLASVTSAQAPGFQRVRIGDLLISALEDGFVISADQFRGGRHPGRYTWLPVSYAPVVESSTESLALCTDRKRVRHKATRRSGEVE